MGRLGKYEKAINEVKMAYTGQPLRSTTLRQIQRDMADAVYQIWVRDQSEPLPTVIVNINGPNIEVFFM